MGKFKVGRLVRIKQLEHGGYGHKVGDVGLITKLEFGQYPIIVVANRESMSDFKPGVLYTSSEQQLEIL